ncbi:Hint domain-containing protein [Nioella sp.]|uniref:Hint domain-containing protein n=1 Tax=Nioella sp. TaxID=1912091 RepID=UPI003B5256E3
MTIYNYGGYNVYKYDKGSDSYLAVGAHVFSGSLDYREFDRVYEVEYQLGTTCSFAGSLELPLVKDGTVRVPVIRSGNQYIVYLPSDLSASHVNFPAAIDPSSLHTSDFRIGYHGGSLIATPNGECAIEELSVGDIVLTEDGRSVAVKWVGKQTVFTAFGPAERLMPVCFAARSLGMGLPRVEALLHKSVEGQASPFPGRTHPTGSVTGMPRAV